MAPASEEEEESLELPVPLAPVSEEEPLVEVSEALVVRVRERDVVLLPEVELTEGYGAPEAEVMAVALAVATAPAGTR